VVIERPFGARHYGFGRSARLAAFFRRTESGYSDHLFFAFIEDSLRREGPSGSIAQIVEGPSRMNENRALPIQLIEETPRIQQDAVRSWHSVHLGNTPRA